MNCVNTSIGTSFNKLSLKKILYGLQQELFQSAKYSKKKVFVIFSVKWPKHGPNYLPLKDIHFHGFM
jgi:hypothetical protein